jgi:hypothetical protein
VNPISNLDNMTVLGYLKGRTSRDPDLLRSRCATFVSFARTLRIVLLFPLVGGGLLLLIGIPLSMIMVGKSARASAATALVRSALLVAAGMLVMLSAAPLFAQNTAVLQGTVTDRNTGTLLAGVRILSSPNGSALTTTDANGGYSLTLEQLHPCGCQQSGILYLQLAHYFIAQTSYNITAFPTTVNITVLPGGTLLQGTIADAATQTGIAGAFVRFFLSQNVAFNGGSYVDGAADGAGRYAVDSSQFYESAADFDVSSSQTSAGGYFMAYGGGFHVGPPFPATQNLSLTGIGSGVALQGTVTDRTTGAPLAGVAILSSPNGSALTTTDANGGYSLTLEQLHPCGCQQSGILYLQLARYFVAQTAYYISAFPTTFNPSLLPGGTLLKGTISDAMTQTGISGAFVRFFLSQNVAFNGGSYVDGAADAAGRYTVDSSQFYESAAGGFDVSSSQALAGGHFIAYGGAFSVGPTFPATQNIQLIPTVNTPSGTNVVVQTSSTSLTFPTVSQGGTTSVTTGSSGPPPPSGFQLGNPPTYYDVTTTAVFSGSPTVCINYSGVNFTDPTQLVILHYDTMVGSWTELSTTVNVATNTACATTSSFSPFAVVQRAYAAQIQQPINPDGSSVFSIKRGVVPVKFTLSYGAVATCKLPSATISVVRTAGGVTGPVDEGVYVAASDSGSSFRIDAGSCQYVYNVGATSLGKGTYRVNISISGRVVGNAILGLQ